MKNSLVISLFALLLSAAAILTLVFADPNEGEQRLLTPEIPVDQLISRLDALSQETRRLQDQVAMLNSRPEAAERVRSKDDFVTNVAFAAFQEELQKVLAMKNLVLSKGAESQPLDAVTPEFTAQVSLALDDIRAQERRAEAKKWVDSRSARLQKRMPDIAQQLGLDAYQENSMTSALQELYQNQADIKLGVNQDNQDGVSPRESWANGISDFQEGLGTYLTTEQITLYRGLGGDLFPGGSKGGK